MISAPKTKVKYYAYIVDKQEIHRPIFVGEYEGKSMCEIQEEAMKKAGKYINNSMELKILTEKIK